MGVTVQDHPRGPNGSRPARKKESPSIMSLERQLSSGKARPGVPAVASLRMSTTDLEIEKARQALAALDPLMANAHSMVPPIAWRVREAGFGGLVRQIVGQQVSVAGGGAIRRGVIDG